MIRQSRYFGAFSTAMNISERVNGVFDRFWKYLDLKIASSINRERFAFAESSQGYVVVSA